MKTVFEALSSINMPGDAMDISRSRKSLCYKLMHNDVLKSKTLSSSFRQLGMCELKFTTHVANFSDETDGMATFLICEHSHGLKY